MTSIKYVIQFRISIHLYNKIQYIILKCFSKSFHFAIDALFCRCPEFRVFTREIKIVYVIAYKMDLSRSYC